LEDTVNVHFCDLCGEKIGKVPAALMLIAMRGESRPRAPTVAEVLGGTDPNNKEERFELCAECGLGLMVAMKAKKLAVRSGTPEVSA
jgi:hypothetical protein